VTVDSGPFSLGPVGESGPAVLCLHGLTGTPYEVRPPAEALVREGFACVGPVLPGHNAPAEELAATPLQAWLDGACEAYDGLASTHERVYVLGLSMGGLLALALGARRSVAGLVVLATPLRLRWVDRIGARLLARFRESIPKTSSIRDPDALRRHPGTDRMPLRAVLQLFRLQRLVREDLARVTAPIHAIFSRLDPTVPIGNADRILGAVGSARRTVRYLERSFHVVTVDVEREAVQGECVRFLRELEAGGAARPALTPGEARPSIAPVRA
jgi:carboxylesterase